MAVVPEYTRRAQDNYRKKLRQKMVSFNTEREEDLALLEALEADDVAFNALVKKLLAEHYNTAK